MISTKCDNCGKNYKLKDSAAGKSINCSCGTIVKVPLEINGEDETPANARSRARQAENNQVKSVKGKTNRSHSLPDLTDKKVCSKCKNIIDMSIKECPKCGFNTMGIKYDITKREENSRKVSIAIYNVGKYVIPAVILIAFIYFFNLQMENLESLRKFEKNIIKTIENEQLKMESENKKDPVANSNTIIRFYLEDKENTPYFIAVPKKNDTVPFSFFGNGFFTLKKAGVKYVVRFSQGSQPKVRHYIEDEKGYPIVINPREYDLHSFESIAFKFIF